MSQSKKGTQVENDSDNKSLLSDDEFVDDLYDDEVDDDPKSNLMSSNPLPFFSVAEREEDEDEDYDLDRQYKRAETDDEEYDRDYAGDSESHDREEFGDTESPNAESVSEGSMPHDTSISSRVVLFSDYEINAITTLGDELEPDHCRSILREIAKNTKHPILRSWPLEYSKFFKDYGLAGIETIVWRGLDKDMKLLLETGQLNLESLKACRKR